MNCKKCGSTISNNVIKCEKCGEKNIQRKSSNIKLIIRTTFVAALLLLVSWGLLKLSLDNSNAYTSSKLKDDHTSGTYFGTAETKNELKGLSNEFKKGREIYFSVSLKEPFHRDNVTLVLINKYGGIEEVQRKIEVPVKPESNYLQGVLDRKNDEKSSLEKGDYIFRITDEDNVLCEGEFSIVNVKSAKPS
ncbi:hypothetical protein [Priestia megaterium]|uniref:hypothetical protein n=1 Tax=Priestia megaterium TaxID=1404 RepID=UPI0031013EBF